MCGINAIANFSDLTLDLENKINAMNNSTNHRGPDGQNYSIINNNIALGFNRLAIRSFSENTIQPISIENVHVLMNGEIYNYDTLKTKYNVQTKSDAEILIHLYKDKGDKFAKYLDGEFSFILIDGNKIIAGVDPLGVRPLYYSYIDKRIVFSSEIKGIFASKIIQKEFNPMEIYHIFTTSGSLEENTIFKNVNKIKPGQILICNYDNIKFETYFDYQKEFIECNEYKDKEITLELFEEVLNQAIQKRTVGIRKKGFTLSGGLDSSLLGYNLSKISKDTSAITLKFQNNALDETEYQNRVISKLQIKEYPAYATSANNKDFFKKILDIFDDLVFQQIQFSSYFLYDKAQIEDIRIMLSGDGADEFFFGYKHHKIIENAIKNQKVDINSEQFQHKDPLYKSLQDTYKKYGSLFFSNHFYFDDELKKEIFTDKYQKLITRKTQEIITEQIKTDNHADQFLLGELKFKFKQILTVMDKVSSHFGIENRLPFLDIELIKIAFAISPEKRFGKQFIKKLDEEIYGTDFVTRKKIGLTFPINELITNKKRLYDAILDCKLMNSGIFKKEYIKHKFDEDINHDGIMCLRTGFLVYFFLWCNYHFEKGELLDYL